MVRFTNIYTLLNKYGSLKSSLMIHLLRPVKPKTSLFVGCSLKPEWKHAQATNIKGTVEMVNPLKLTLNPPLLYLYIQMIFKLCDPSQPLYLCHSCGSLKVLFLKSMFYAWEQICPVKLSLLTMWLIYLTALLFICVTLKKFKTILIYFFIYL